MRCARSSCGSGASRGRAALLLLVQVVVVTLLALLCAAPLPASAAVTTAHQLAARQHAGAAPRGAAADNYARVAVDLFVMSKCPDAMFTENFLAPLLHELHASITLQLHFIGDKHADGSWHCKHGPDECAGDTQQLCVQQGTKPYNRAKWLLGFVLCANKHGDAIGSFATASTCLKEAGIPLASATKMLACTFGPGHADVLAADLAATATLGVTTSATLQLDGVTVAVRDGGEWRRAPGGAHSLADFKSALCGAIAAKQRGRLPPECGSSSMAHPYSVAAQ